MAVEHKKLKVVKALQHPLAFSLSFNSNYSVICVCMCTVSAGKGGIRKWVWAQWGQELSLFLIKELYNQRTHWLREHVPMATAMTY